MSVRWPDGSVTGSVRVGKTAPNPVEPVKIEEPVKAPEKEVPNGAR